jgi:hypothetical protein
MVFAAVVVIPWHFTWYLDHNYTQRRGLKHRMRHQHSFVPHLRGESSKCPNRPRNRERGHGKKEKTNSMKKKGDKLSSPFLEGLRHKERAGKGGKNEGQGRREWW